ncbi:MAG: DUF58 domain-containing protein [Steroidobacteraceae bacterium]|nr:DUF58 domain-containing protein [Deltaproteobacteria bacterium]
MSVTGLAGMYNIKGLAPELLPPDDIFAGTAAPFRLRVRNSKRRLPSFLIRLECHSGQALTFPLVQPQAVCEGIVMLTFNQRGLVPAGRLKISSPYPVGFFSRYWTFESSTVFTVFPRPLAAAYPASGDDTSRSGMALRRERGIDGELERIDPYSGAEPLRSIHWKLSARTPGFLVKGFGRQSAAPLLIDPSELPGQGLEERLSRAAWLVRRWVRERPVGLVLAGRVIPAGFGKRHGRTLLKELALYGLD